MESRSPVLLQIHQVRTGSDDKTPKGFRREKIDGKVVLILKNPEIMGVEAANACKAYGEGLLEIELIQGAEKNGLTLIQRGLVGQMVILEACTATDKFRHSAFKPIFDAVNEAVPQKVSWLHTSLETAIS